MRLRPTSNTREISTVPSNPEVTIDGDYADLSYQKRTEPFERIRRITGYLVGTLDRFNDAKRAEESERVKHTI